MWCLGRITDEYRQLAERFLVDVLALPWEDAHDEACRLEHALSERVLGALEREAEEALAAHERRTRHADPRRTPASPTAGHCAPMCRWRWVILATR